MKRIITLTFILSIAVTSLFSQESPLDGVWNLMRDKGTYLDYFRSLVVEFSVRKNEVSIRRSFGPKRPHEDQMTLKTGGTVNEVKITDVTIPTTLFQALQYPVGKTKKVTAEQKNGTAIIITEQYDVLSSQGSKPTSVRYLYELTNDKNIMTCKIERDSRKDKDGVTLFFKKAGYNNAYVYQMVDDWDIFSKLPEQACLISIQGIVNENRPNLYFIYGPQFPFNYTEELYTYLEKQRNFTFTRLGSLEQCLSVFKDSIKGYIVWDKKERTSLIVAYTLAGLEKGIVITEDLIPLAKKYGLKEIDDFRGRFSGWSDFKIYTWAKEKYWSRCNKELIIWLGGIHGTAMQPNVADYGMTQKVFFNDLSARSTDTLEYGLSKQLLSEIKPLGRVMGWHSYKKDMEEEWVTLTSSYALGVDGLNSLPNTSFLYKVPASPGFKYTNHHNVKPGVKYVPEKKTYIALVQTDGLGLGAWVRPGRGSIPFAWEVCPNFEWLSPAMMEYYYTQATPNDYFIGALSGSAYMYPKAFPKQWLVKEIEKADRMMKSLDLNVYEIMDYSGEKTEAAENNLTKEIVDAYYEGMPDAIGFLNGYYASETFSVRNKVPFVSYDYYLPADKPEAEVAADLKELAGINSVRPYFLLVHVRENSDVARVKSITDRLGSGFEIVPLDVFLKMAGENTTFKERYLDKK
jgi:hypothetical protein